MLIIITLKIIIFKEITKGIVYIVGTIVWIVGIFEVRSESNELGIFPYTEDRAFFLPLPNF